MKSHLLELMYDALRSDTGIVISVSDMRKTRAMFYELRKTDPDLAQLSTAVSPVNDNELWLVKNGTKPDEA